MNVNVLGAVFNCIKEKPGFSLQVHKILYQVQSSTPDHSRKRPLLVTQLDFSLPVMIIFFFEFPRY